LFRRADPVHQIGLEFRNKSLDVIEVAWDQSVYIDEDGNSSRLIRGNVNLAEKDRPQPNTVIPPGEELRGMAFQDFFEKFDLIPCPSAVRQMANGFGIEIPWRKPKGIIRCKLDAAGGGLSYRNQMTVFVRDGAKLETGYHESGHILFGCIRNDAEILALFMSLQQKAYAIYPVMSQEEMTPVQHPVTGCLALPAPGRYVLINRRYHGLDHSGAEAEGDELWASLFEEYQSGRELKSGIRALVEE
jgi:hypothetical protein